MPTGQPMELAQSLGNEVAEFVHGITHTDAVDKFVFAHLMRECERLQKSDVVHASLLKALLASSIGDTDEMERWFANAERNGAGDQVQVERLRHCVNHGHATRALNMAPQAFARRGPHTLMSIAEMAAAIGALNTIVQAVAASQERGEVLRMTPLLDVAKRGAQVMAQLGVSDADIAAMLDVAGEMLRARKLLWQNNCIDLSVLDGSQGGPALFLAYRIDLSPAQAAQMGWTLTEELVRRDLLRCGVSVDFLGTAMAEPKAA